MIKLGILLLISCQFLTLSANGEEKKYFFRKDYTYLPASESFYKIHTIHTTWQQARKKCATEGSYLYFPEDKAETDAVFQFWNQTQPFYWIYIGVSSLIAKGNFVTIDGRPIDEVYNNWSPGEPNDADGKEDCVILRRDGTLNDDQCSKKFPYICKKTLASLQWNQPCDIPDMSYTYNDVLGKCYKFHLNPMNWTDAYTVCHAEQSYLAVINTKSESEELVKICEHSPKDKVFANYLGVVHLGFHNRDDEGWTTVKGQPLGHSNWESSQLDGADYKKCGSMLYNGTLNPVDCDHKAFFICEHDVKGLGNLFDERFNSS